MPQHPFPSQPSLSTVPPVYEPEEKTQHGVSLVQATPYISRSRTYAFVVDENGQPIELGSGRFAKAYLGEERWVESKTTFRRNVAIKCLQCGVSTEDQMRFQMEKEILERVQGHPNIIEILASGEADSLAFIPDALRGKVENDFMILQLCDLSLEERLTGSRNGRNRDELVSLGMRERIFRVLEYVVPIACAIEYAHLIRDTSHRDIKPANILLKLPDPTLRGSQLSVILADFNVGKAAEADSLSMTQYQSVPGTMFYQSPEQETNAIELLVNVSHGSTEVQFFEDFYIDIYANDTFQLYNRPETYKIASANRERKKITLERPFGEVSETNVRAKITKAVGRPADIYSIGTLLYYLISGAYANPKTLYDAFRKFIEYDRRDDNNTVTAYIEHEYRVIQNMRAPRTDEDGVEIAPEDRFFSYKHYLDGNGELIDWHVMLIVAKAMIRNKPDSYCNSWDLRTTGISRMVHDLLSLYVRFGADPGIRSVGALYDAPRKAGIVSRTLSRIRGLGRKR